MGFAFDYSLHVSIFDEIIKDIHAIYTNRRTIKGRKNFNTRQQIFQLALKHVENTWPS